MNERIVGTSGHRGAWTARTVVVVLLGICAPVAGGGCGEDSDPLLGAASGAGGAGGGGTAGNGVAGGAGAGGLNAGAGGVVSQGGVAGAVVCVPGSTQQCVGKGACAGGQECRDDGSGWKECDCGAAGSGGGEAGAGGTESGDSGAGGSGGTMAAGAGGTTSTGGTCDVPEGTIICTESCGVPLPAKCPRGWGGKGVDKDVLEITGPTTIALAATDASAEIGCAPFHHAGPGKSWWMWINVSGKLRATVNPPWTLLAEKSSLSNSGCNEPSSCIEKLTEQVLVVHLAETADKGDVPLALVEITPTAPCP